MARPLSFWNCFFSNKTNETAQWLAYLAGFLFTTGAGHCTLHGVARQEDFEWQKTFPGFIW
jgi:hypothetical protein